MSRTKKRPLAKPRESSSRADAAFGVHQVGQDVVDAGEVAFAFGAQPGEHLRVETDADRQPCALRRAAAPDSRVELRSDAESDGEHPAGAEAQVVFQALSARLKSCPDTKRVYETRHEQIEVRVYPGLKPAFILLALCGS